MTAHHGNVRHGQPGAPLDAAALGRLLFECDHAEFGTNAVGWDRVSPFIHGYRIEDATRVLEHVNITWKGEPA